MNQLLIPVDFSPASGAAISYASRLAIPIGVQRLVLLYCFSIDDDVESDHTSHIDSLSDMEDLLMDFYHAYVKEPFIELRLLIKPGSVMKNVISYSKDCELIVMSSNKVGTQVRGWMGSRSFYIAATADCPVLIVPAVPNYFTAWEKIWHIKQKDDELAIVREQLKRLNIDQQRIITKSFQQNNFSSLLWRLIVAYSQAPAEDIRHSILEACQTENIDLLLLVSDRIASFRRLIKDELVQIIFQFEIPILILPRSAKD